jgi:hypothetical protein
LAATSGGGVLIYFSRVESGIMQAVIR